MANNFPNDIILLPSVSYSGFYLKHGFVAEMMADAQRRFQRPMANPWLIGISAGGRGVLNLYTQHPGHYKGVIALACNFPEQAGRRLKPKMRIGWLVGTREQALPAAMINRKRTLVAQHVKQLHFAWIDGDHFFFATNPKISVIEIKKVLTIE